ncbi:MAG: hypothetical protein P8X82_16340, partial [Gemmatimonadales bacterium]
MPGRRRGSEGRRRHAAHAQDRLLPHDGPFGKLDFHLNADQPKLGLHVYSNTIHATAVENG